MQSVSMIALRHAARTCAVVAVFGAMPAHAQEDEGFSFPGELSGYVTFGNDYLFRGISQTLEDPSVQGGLDWSHDTGIFFSVFASNVDFGGGAEDGSVEIDYIGGYGQSFGPFTVSASATFFHYPGSDPDLDFNYIEFGPDITYDHDLVSASAGFTYTFENFGATGEAFFPYFDVSLSLPFGLTPFGHIGFNVIEDAAGFGTDDYLDWQLGVARDFPELFDINFSLSYVDTNIDVDDTDADPGVVDLSDARVLFLATRSF